MPSRAFWELSHHGSAPAVIDAATGRAHSYADVQARVQALAARLTNASTQRGERALVFLACGVDLGSIVAYLAALSAGHAVFLMDGAAHPQQRHALAERYRPDFLLTTHGEDVAVEVCEVGAPRPLHPALAVLLSTSGTTGSPRLVRLSTENLCSNAGAIADYLDLDAHERAIASLPFHYSYGLSVINSHLRVGASIVIPDASILRREFWDTFREHACTSFAGVPYSYQILRRIGFQRFDLPSLRTLTQAGGKLPPAQVSELARWMAERGGRFFAMYGQTEATARMSYLPPEAALDAPGSIGRAIPGGSLHVMDGERELHEAGETGELVYRGPNVMLGYATCAEELSLGDQQGGVLRTGDLGRRGEDGFFYVTGRLKRFAKVYGLRVNLDEVEGMIRAHGPAAVVSDDQSLTVFCEFADADLWAALKAELAARLGLNINTFRFEHVAELPRLGSGKVDYGNLGKRLR